MACRANCPRDGIWPLDGHRYRYRRRVHRQLAVAAARHPSRSRNRICDHRRYNWRRDTFNYRPVGKTWRPLVGRQLTPRAGLQSARVLAVSVFSKANPGLAPGFLFGPPRWAESLVTRTRGPISACGTFRPFEHCRKADAIGGVKRT
jgi:hypothetical protein